MNKQKKRAISRGKFERVASSDGSVIVKNGILWHKIVYYKNYVYWRDINVIQSRYEYFRKSISEALS